MRSESLNRGLRARHIQLLAIGGTIGVGLFLGSGRAIQLAGPALIAVYAIGGIVVFFLMRALGELLVYKPVAGSFVEYANEFLGAFAGFATGWSYWFMWIVTCMVEATAVGIYCHYWFASLPQWLPALSLIVLLYGLNRLTVRIFGEVEFWFATIKVATIVALLIMGVCILVFRVGPLGSQARLDNLWMHGGVLPHGVAGMLLTLQIVMFAYTGVELIGVTAGEAADPETVLPRANNSIIYRILLFFVGSMVIIMSLLPWTAFTENVSPFVLVFERMGIPGAGHLMNFVVLTAAASSCNSGLFSTGRMLFSLSKKGHAPPRFALTDRRHIPVQGITASAACMLIGVYLNYLAPGKVFTWLSSVSVVAILWTWVVIMLAHRGYRRAVRSGLARQVAYRMPAAQVGTWAVLAAVFFTAVMLAFDRETRVALYVAPPWFAMLGLVYWCKYKIP